MVVLVGLANIVTNKCGWLNTLPETRLISANVLLCAENMCQGSQDYVPMNVCRRQVSPLSYLTKSKRTRDKKLIFTMLGEVGMANKSTNTTQTSLRMAQHNAYERTRLA